MADISGSRSGHQRPGAIWLYAISAAETEADVVIALRDFLATWTPSEISTLPVDCRPGRIANAEDINEMAYFLSTEHLSSQVELAHSATLERLMSFFTHATARIAELRGKHHAIDADAGGH